MKHTFVFCIAICFSATACAQQANQTKPVMEFEVVKTESEWRSQLDPEQFRILREKGTERPYTGDLYYETGDGIYACAGCDNLLFKSDTKFDARCGWPSFYAPISENAIRELPDYTHGMIRTEVVCGKCGGHLGHVFEDGPAPTGLRYCINSVSMEFQSEKETE
jgi:peptide-methionine (R)-S-oxide reductase